MSALSEQLHGDVVYENYTGGISRAPYTFGHPTVILPSKSSLDSSIYGVNARLGIDVQSFNRATLYLKVASGSCALDKVWVQKIHVKPTSNRGNINNVWIDHGGFLGSNDVQNTLTEGTYSLELDLLVAKYLRVVVEGQVPDGGPRPDISLWLSMGGLS